MIRIRIISRGELQNNDAQGKFLFKKLSAGGVDIINEGSKPTFKYVVKKEILDLTLADPFITNQLRDRHVYDVCSMSDH